MICYGHSREIIVSDSLTIKQMFMLLSSSHPFAHDILLTFSLPNGNSMVIIDCTCHLPNQIIIPINLYMQSQIHCYYPNHPFSPRSFIHIASFDSNSLIKIQIQFTTKISIFPVRSISPILFLRHTRTTPHRGSDQRTTTRESDHFSGNNPINHHLFF
jgi:hypothetical protein